MKTTKKTTTKINKKITTEETKAIKEESLATKPPKNSFSEVILNRKDLKQNDFKPKVAVIGIGGGGGNAINAVVESKIDNVLTIAYNTDAQALEYSHAKIRMQLGPEVTKGQGAGANPKIGELAAIESEDLIREHLQGIHVVFVVACMGGGTGTGASSVISKIALDMGILTIGLVTTPFQFEGDKRNKTAQSGLEKLQENCDVLIVVSNQNLYTISNQSTTFSNSFALTDEVLSSGLKSFLDTLNEPARINVDLADFFAIMKGRKSRARMGTSFAEGPDRALQAAQDAMSSPLLELGGMMSKDIDGLIICIKCGYDMTLDEITQAVNYIRNSVSSDANIIFGTTIDEKMENKIQLSVFATSSTAQKEQLEEKNYNQVFEEKSKEATFDQLLQFNENDLIGTPHSNAINEEHSEFLIEEKKGLFKSFFNSIKNLFFKKKNSKPPYLR